jgi:hypothetical protein
VKASKMVDELRKVRGVMARYKTRDEIAFGRLEDMLK